MATIDNLKAAFAGESQARNKYTAFATRADADGFPGVARLFRAAAEAELVHAQNHFRSMGGVGTTEENLKAAIEGETYEFTDMYPTFLAEARGDGSSRAVLQTLEGACAAEKVHAELYTAALGSLDAKEDEEYFVCPVCGYIEKRGAPEQCPICHTSGTKFRNVG